MTPQVRLGGFKILKDVAWISFFDTTGNKKFPAKFCRLMAEEEINILFLTCGNQDQAWGLNVVIESGKASNACSLVEKRFGSIGRFRPKADILSLFPHRSNLLIVSSFFKMLGNTAIEPAALAHSNSAISSVFCNDVIEKTASALFDQFSFSSYRTPADWQLAQKGKEKLYKEVVASYQEATPKVYGLEWQDRQELVRVDMNRSDLGGMGAVFKAFSAFGIAYSFLMSSPSKEKDTQSLFLCLSQSDRPRHIDLMIKKLLPDAAVTVPCPVAVFSMNGPHFGERYGIASELLFSFSRTHIELLALSCSIHSIMGVLPSEQVHFATQAIQSCFEVPSVTIRT